MKRRGFDRHSDHWMRPRIVTKPMFNVARNRDHSLKTIPLKIVTWNVSGRSISAHAPSGWFKENDKNELIFAQTLEQKPDIICFQELTSGKLSDPLIKRFHDDRDWAITEAHESHCGFTRLIVHRKINYLKGLVADITPSDTGYPRIVLRKKGSRRARLVIYGVHLPPFVDGAENRRDIFDSIVKETERVMGSLDHLAIVGDTNMRRTEEKDIIDEGFRHCWDIAHSFIPTWHMCFFERGSKAFTRFDRLFHGRKIETLSVGVFDQSVSKDPHHMLSDHRGVVVTVRAHK